MAKTFAEVRNSVVRLMKTMLLDHKVEATDVFFDRQTEFALYDASAADIGDLAGRILIEGPRVALGERFLGLKISWDKPQFQVGVAGGKMLAGGPLTA